MIYLDYAATTPMSNKAIEVYGEVARRYFGNASSLHDYGSSANQILDKGRETIGGMLNAEPRGIYFTGGGSDANRLVLQSLAKGNRDRGRHLITTRAEHSSVRHTCRLLEEQGFEIDYTPVDPKGRVVINKLKKLIREDTILVSIHHGNSEIGTIQDLEKIGSVVNGRGVLFHSDCVQTFGKVPIDVKKAGLDALSISAHKVYGPKGVGTAYLKPAISWKPVIPGTTHEKGFRQGTVDVPAVAAFTAAAREMAETGEKEQIREAKLRKLLLEELPDDTFEITLEGDPEPGSACQLPNIVGMRIHGMEGQYAMIECNRLGLAISTGSACSVGSEKPAASMVALGREQQEAREFIRLSLGKQTSEQEIYEAVKILRKVLTHHFSMVKL